MEDAAKPAMQEENLGTGSKQEPVEEHDEECETAEHSVEGDVQPSCQMDGTQAQDSAGAEPKTSPEAAGYGGDEEGMECDTHPTGDEQGEERDGVGVDAKHCDESLPLLLGPSEEEHRSEMRSSEDVILKPEQLTKKEGEEAAVDKQEPVDGDKGVCDEIASGDISHPAMGDTEFMGDTHVDMERMTSPEISGELDTHYTCVS